MSVITHAEREQALQRLFNAQWYLEHYPDVAAAGMDPWHHFIHHGRQEQRLPCPSTALALEEQLWRGHTHALGELQTLANTGGTEAAIAAWVLARWHASNSEHTLAEPLLRAFFADVTAGLLVGHAGPWLLMFHVLWHQGKMQEATAWLEQPGWPKVPDWALARFMLPEQHTLATLNEFYQEQGLCSVALHHAQQPLTLDNLSAPQAPAAVRAWWQRKPLVSIIMPCFNAGAGIATALRSLQQQSWKNLEILVVDDASADNSASIVAGLAARDPRIKLLRHSVNQGAYAARNTALAQARGTFITTHDCDDWSHPQKIELQVKALLKYPKAQACISYMIRCSPELHFERWRMEESWVTKNLSSLMFRKKVRKALGYWDSVSVGADSEFYHRILKHFGINSLIEIIPGIPLMFARVNGCSLTQQSKTHLRTHYQNNGIRRRYHNNALAWQQNARTLYMPARPEQRPFAAPAPMCRGTARAKEHNLRLLAEQSTLFDGDWYLRRYPDVAAAGMEPLQHYLRFGHLEWRDPGPHFSGSGYQFAVPEAQQQNPLLHLLRADTAHEYALPLLNGALAWRSDRPVLLLCAHLVSDKTYGAERSFLDVLSALGHLPYNLLVTLPSAQNMDYVEQIRSRCQHLVVLPYHWWQHGRSAEQATVVHFSGLIKENNVALVYCNTLTLWEPLLAAKACGVPAVSHVRELPEHDAALCTNFNASSEQIRQHLLEHCDAFIANSQVVARYLNAPGRVHVVGNVIEAQAFSVPLPGKSRVQVGMISSNLPKKGLYDFVQLASLLQQQGVPATCVLIGPENEHTQALFSNSEAPVNLEFAGYSATPQAALAQLDVLVNLSHFQESFGRTVLEAMAASRPVVCYYWGALPELVVHEQTGFLAPKGDVQQVAEHVAALVANHELRTSMGMAGRQRAEQLYSMQHMQQAFTHLLPGLIGSAKNKEN
ncbi:glycosyltransferase [Oceanimonas sp. AH20CE76]|uniref:glycosyltransferase n=1 Tax=Oceanimonas sp. AH20CE76 TaxID=2977120 RepID=UPI0031FEFC9C